MAAAPTIPPATRSDDVTAYVIARSTSLAGTLIKSPGPLAASIISDAQSRQQRSGRFSDPGTNVFLLWHAALGRIDCSVTVQSRMAMLNSLSLLRWYGDSNPAPLIELHASLWQQYNTATLAATGKAPDESEALLTLLRALPYQLQTSLTYLTSQPNVRVGDLRTAIIANWNQCHRSGSYGASQRGNRGSSGEAMLSFGGSSCTGGGTGGGHRGGNRGHRGHSHRGNGRGYSHSNRSADSDSRSTRHHQRDRDNRSDSGNHNTGADGIIHLGACTDEYTHSKQPDTMYTLTDNGTLGQCKSDSTADSDIGTLAPSDTTPRAGATTAVLINGSGAILAIPVSTACNPRTDHLLVVVDPQVAMAASHHCGDNTTLAIKGGNDRGMRFLAGKWQFVLDTGATRHIVGNSALLSNTRDVAFPMVAVGQKWLTATKLATVKLTPKVHLHNVAYVKGAGVNLLCVTRLMDDGCNVFIGKTRASVKLNGDTILEFDRVQNLYVFTVPSDSTSSDDSDVEIITHKSTIPKKKVGGGATTGATRITTPATRTTTPDTLATTGASSTSKAGAPSTASGARTSLQQQRTGVGIATKPAAPSSAQYLYDSVALCTDAVTTTSTTTLSGLTVLAPDTVVCVRDCSADMTYSLLDVEHSRSGHMHSLAASGCQPCIAGKSTRRCIRHTTDTSKVATATLDRLHADLVGLVTGTIDGERQRVTSGGGSAYALLVVDEYSRHVFAMPLASKADAAQCVQRLCQQLHTQLGKPVKEFHSDSGGGSPVSHCAPTSVSMASASPPPLRTRHSSMA